MSEKRARQIRKGLNEIGRNAVASRQEISDGLVRELLEAPFKYRFRFAMKLIFYRKK